jgi:hypothetical protein
MAGKL